MEIKDDSFFSFSFGYRMRKDVLLSSGAREIEKKLSSLQRIRRLKGPMLYMEDSSFVS